MVCRIEQLRRQRWTSPAIAARVRVPLATVGEVLRRLGLNRLGRKALWPPTLTPLRNATSATIALHSPPPRGESFKGVQKQHQRTCREEDAALFLAFGASRPCRSRARSATNALT